jgi:hypothetical protein
MKQFPIYASFNGEDLVGELVGRVEIHTEEMPQFLFINDTKYQITPEIDEIDYDELMR